MPPAPAGVPALTPLPDPRLRPFTSLSAAGVKGPPLEVELAPCTAVVGPNHARKTAVLDAVRLALLGKHPIGPASVDLLKLAPAGVDEIKIVLSGPDGRAVFAAQRGRKIETPHYEGKIDRLSEHERAQILPPLSLDALLGGRGPTTIRAALLIWFASEIEAVTATRTPPGLSVEQVKLWHAELEAAASGLDAFQFLDLLAQLPAAFRSRKLAAGRDLAALVKEIAARGKAGDRESPTEAEIAMAQRKLEAARLHEGITAHLQRLAELEARLLETQAKAAQLQQEAPPYPPPGLLKQREVVAAAQKEQEEASTACRELKERIQLRVSIRTALERACAAGATGCPVCNSPIGREGLKRRIEAVRERTAAFEVQELAPAHARERAAVTAHFLAEGALQTLEAAADRARREHAAALDEVTVAARGYAWRIEEIAAVIGDKSVDPGITAAAAQAALEDLQKRHQAAGSVDDLQARRRQTARLRDDYKTLEEEANELLKQTLGTVQEIAERRVNAYLPAGYKATLDVAAGEWCVYGADALPHGRGAMSGSEEAALYLALAGARYEKAPLRVLLLDDSDLGRFDPAGIRVLLDAIRTSVQDGRLTQAIVAWTRPQEIPADWHILPMGEAEAGAVLPQTLTAYLEERGI